MARIVISSCLFRYPMGGMMSWLLQYLVGFARLGHEVWYVEQAARPNDWFDPTRDTMTDDCGYGARTVGALLSQHGFGERWHLVDRAGRRHGAPRERIEAAFERADLFVDMGGDGSWLADAASSRLRILIDCEPGFTQMKLASRLEAGETLLHYDAYYTPGANVGTERSSVPTAGRAWRKVVDPVVPDLFEVTPAEPGAAYTTVMSWQSMRPRVYQGRTYGNKDVEFARFESLPQRTEAPLELAVSGRDVPWQRLAQAGWRTLDANQVSRSFASYAAYIRGARGEFTVAKHCFVATNCGWFGDRAAVFLASGRPVVMQDTGWSEHLPCGEGLFAVRSVEEAAAALDEIEHDYPRHARRARQIAEEFLDAERALGHMLGELGVRG
jgi:hypothetical protein